MSAEHTILYAEDDLDDLFIIKQAFEIHSSNIEIVHANNGFEALQFLTKAHQHNTALPCLIILDINMPGMDGREALIHIKQTESLKNIPIVLFTTSSSLLDKAFAEKWGAGFITKPSVYSEMEVLVKTFIDLCDFSTAKAKEHLRKMSH